MNKQLPDLSVLKGEYAIHQLDAERSFPSNWQNSELFAFVKTSEELSLVCDIDTRIDSLKKETGWKAIKVEGPLAFSLTGILANISAVLAKANTSIFAISTYDTDYVLVKTKRLDKSIQALKTAGYIFLQH